jgi:hypothetical protein
LALSIIKEGAADMITKTQADADPFRLRSCIKKSLIRSQLMHQMEQKHKDEIAVIKKQGKALKKAEELTAQQLLEKDQIIHWMSGGYSVESTAKKRI